MQRREGPKWPVLMNLDNVSTEPLFIFKMRNDMILMFFRLSTLAIIMVPQLPGREGRSPNESYTQREK